MQLLTDALNISGVPLLVHSLREVSFVLHEKLSQLLVLLRKEKELQVIKTRYLLLVPPQMLFEF